VDCARIRCGVARDHPHSRLKPCSQAGLVGQEPRVGSGGVQGHQLPEDFSFRRSISPTQFIALALNSVRSPSAMSSWSKYSFASPSFELTLSQKLVARTYLQCVSVPRLVLCNRLRKASSVFMLVLRAKNNDRPCTSSQARIPPWLPVRRLILRWMRK